MTKEFIYTIIRQHQLAVLATSSTGLQPQAALIGFAITEDLEIVFDTVTTSRKYANLSAHPRAALVIGWENETTVQYEGVARELRAEQDDDTYREVYYSVFPEGRQRAVDWLQLTHFVIRPQWIRYSNFNDPSVIEELSFP